MVTYQIRLYTPWKFWAHQGKNNTSVQCTWFFLFEFSDGNGWTLTLLITLNILSSSSLERATVLKAIESDLMAILRSLSMVQLVHLERHGNVLYIASSSLQYYHYCPLWFWRQMGVIQSRMSMECGQRPFQDTQPLLLALVPISLNLSQVELLDFVVEPTAVVQNGKMSTTASAQLICRQQLQSSVLSPGLVS